jgi:hypothetical protein
LAPLALYLQLDILTLATVGAYFLLNFVVVGFSASKLKEKNVIFFLPFLELFLVLFQITIFIANSISKPTHWK